MRLPSGYGSVVKLSGNRRKPYAVRVTASWTDEGRQKYKYLSYHTTHEDALMALAAYNNDPSIIDTGKLTFADVYRRWSAKAFEGIDPRNKNRGDLERNYIRSKALHHMKMNTIKTHQLQQIMDGFKLAYSASSKVKVLWVALFDWAIVNDVVDRNYAKYVKVSSEIKSELHKPYSDDEVKVLWDKVGTIPNVDYILMSCYMGWRPSELLDVKISNIDLAERTIKGGSKTEAGKDRIVPIHTRIVPLIEARIQAAKGDVLFYTDRGNPMSYASLKNNYWPQMMQDLGMDHQPHDGRHTCSTNLDRKGANKMTIKFILGHKSQDVTEKVYTHKVIEDLINAIDLLD